MSQLDKVLRRSIAHLDPSDIEGRERVFASAREAMIRLLRVYDPPLNSFEIDSKIREFDEVVGSIARELLWLRPRGLPALAAVGSAAHSPLALPPPVRAALPPPLPEVEVETDAEIEPPFSDFDDEIEGEADDYLDDYEDGEPDDYEDDYLDEDGYDEAPRALDRLMDFIDGISWRVVAAVAVGILLLGAAGVLFLHRGAIRPASPQVETAAAKPAVQEEPAAAPTVAAAPAPAAAQPAPPTSSGSSGDLALESLVIFDGRDPSVFQSAPDNPVTFQGDADGGFARVSSSSGSTGARLQVGRGVYERIAGHRIRLVIVARAAHTAPATGLRFAYQNGRAQSPWTDVAIGAAYTPLSAVWLAPKERGGPENDSVIIEPGVPGDGTAIDIRSVRIEILG